MIQPTELLESFRVKITQAGIAPVYDLEPLLRLLQLSQILELCFHLAHQFLPLYQYYIKNSDWVRTSLYCMQMSMPLGDMIFEEPFKEVDRPFPSNDLELALQSYFDGMVFLSLAFEAQHDFETLTRKASISIGHFVVAIVSEFCGKHYAPKWENKVNEYGVIERWIAPSRITEVERFRATIWFNIADEIEYFLGKNK